MAFGFAGIVELLLAPPGLSIWLILAGVWLLYRRDWFFCTCSAHHWLPSCCSPVCRPHR